MQSSRVVDHPRRRPARGYVEHPRTDDGNLLVGRPSDRRIETGWTGASGIGQALSQRLSVDLTGQFDEALALTIWS